METLSRLGRTEICKRFGIKDKNSIFVNDKDAFIDRMSLLNNYYDVQGLIDVYKEEMSKHASESVYQSSLNDKENNMYSKLKDLIETVIENRETINMRMKHCKTEMSTPVETELPILRIYFRAPVYEAVQFTISERTSNYVGVTLEDYILMHTESKYLSKAISDLDISKFDKDLINEIIYLENDIATILFSQLTPRFLNKKELLKIGQCEVEYATSKHISAETLYKIIDYIVNIDTVDLSRVEMEVYQLKQLNNAGTIYKKEMIIGDINNSRVIFGDDSTEKIAYLRGLTGDSPTDYDRYFEYNGKQAKISQNIDLDWKDKSILEGTK